MLPRDLHTYKLQNPSAHGGRFSLRARKTRRWVSTSKTMHIVLRSNRAVGPWSMLQRKHRARIRHLVWDTAARCGVKIHGFQNVGNHLHIHVRAPTRVGWQYFLRVFPQRVMFAVTGAKKGNPKGRFWALLAFSRVVEWGREHKTLRKYLNKNAKQAWEKLKKEGDWMDVPG